MKEEILKLIKRKKMNKVRKIFENADSAVYLITVCGKVFVYVSDTEGTDAITDLDDPMEKTMFENYCERNLTDGERGELMMNILKTVYNNVYEGEG